MFKHFSKHLQKIFSDAEMLARNVYNTNIVQLPHIFLSFIYEDKNTIIDTLLSLNISIEALIEEVDDFAIKNNIKSNEDIFIYDNDCKNILKSFENTSRKISLNDFFLEMLNQTNEFTSLLLDLEVTYVDVIEIIEDVNEIDNVIMSVEKDNVSSKKKFLNDYTVNLINKARDGKIDDVFGREEEKTLIYQTMLRTKKRNCILVGKAGVGKTGIVESIAKDIYNNDSPNLFASKKIYSLDVNKLVSGTRYRGDFEERVNGILKECIEDKNVILFIDEAHVTLNAGNSSSDVNIQNVLKPAMARGDVQVIMSTTRDEYRKYMERDKAFIRRCEIINIEEPDFEVNVMIINKILSSYKNVSFEDDISSYIVEVTEKYIKHSNFPDKAIDVLDATVAKKMLSPSESDIINQLKMALSNTIEQKKNVLKNNDFYEAIPLNKEEKSIRYELKHEMKENKSKMHSITKKDVTNYIEKKYDVSLSSTDITPDKYNQLKDSVIGQEEAIDKFYKSFVSAKINIDNDKLPVLLFVGQSGVGKTLLTEKIAEIFFKDKIIKIDCGQYQTPIDINKLIGSPAGYIGYEEGGKLTNHIKNYPFSVILFDEIEKAHDSLYDMLLNLFDKKIIYDAKGEEYDATNCLIIMTSNVGVKKLNLKSIGYSSKNENNKERQNIIETEIEKHFKPEFINRIDETIFFNNLTRENLRSIFMNMFNSYKDKLKIKYPDYKVHLTESKINEFLDECKNDLYGARQINTIFQKRIRLKTSFDIFNNIKNIIIE